MSDSVNTGLVPERIDVAIVGGGQAGLATSRELAAAGVEHVVFERARIGETWRGWWDTFCLVTPNWSVQLPGRHYDGDDPDGFMVRDDIVAYLERYADAFDLPVRDHTEVESLDLSPGGGFDLRTSGGDVHATAVVVATGAYQRAHRPSGADTLPADVPRLDVEDYRNPDELPPGAVLIVGSGQSGCQIAEELLSAGREVFLSCGKAPWAPRRIADRDVVWWAMEDGFFDQTPADVPWPAARMVANVVTTGHDGGHDLHLRTLRAAGATLLGHFLGADGRRATFADDLVASVAWGDDRCRDLMDGIRRVAAARDLPLPDIDEPEQFHGSAPTELDLTRVGTVLFAGGYRPDYGSWMRVPGAYDDLGFPVHEDGTSTAAEGLHFVGVHFLRTRKSSLLLGVGEDATAVASGIAARLGAGGS